MFSTRMNILPPDSANENCTDEYWGEEDNVVIAKLARQSA